MKLFVVSYNSSDRVSLNSGMATVGADGTTIMPSVMNVPANAGPVVAAAYKAIGTPYVWGGTTPGKGIDCSGLTLTCYAASGKRLPRTAAAQCAYAKKQGTFFTYNPAQMRPGDQFFIDSSLNGKISHTGLVSKVEGGKVFMIHAPKKGDFVKEVPIDRYYLPRIIGCARW